MNQKSTRAGPSIRTLLVLGRVSNLPTVWSNCLAGWLIAQGGPLERLLLVFPSHPWHAIDAIAAVALAAGFGAAFVLSGAVAWRSSAPVEAG